MSVKKLGTASVDVEADVKPFGTDLAAKLKAAMSEGDREAKAAGKRLGKNIVDGIGDEIIRRTPALRRRINLMLRGITVTAKVKVNLDVDTGKAQASRLAARLQGNIEGNLLGPLKSAQGGVGGLSKSLESIPMAARLGIYGLIGILALGPALFGMFNSLGREVLNVGKGLAFLPAGISVLAAAGLTAMAAFSGMSDAIKAAFGHDPKALAEAIKGLTPSAREFVLELHKALPILEQIKQRAQEGLFAPLRGEVTQIATSLGPIISSGMSKVAGALGGVLKQIADVLESPASQQFLTNLFAVTASIITTLGPPLASLINAFIAMANAGLPGISSVATVLAGLIQKLADWLSAAVADGRFQGWLDSAYKTFGDIWYVVSQLWQLFAVLFDNANSEGSSFLRIIGDIIKWLVGFAQSQPGKMAFEGMATWAKIVGVILLALLGSLFAMIAAISVFITAVKNAIEWVGHLIGKVGNFFSSSLSSLSHIGIPGHAAGAIVHRPELATLAEDGPEVVIPLTRPSRARELAQSSGLTRMLRPGDGGNVTQIFYLGEEQVQARMVQIADSRITGAVTDATYGTRAAA